MGELDGKVAMTTGAGSGLGRASVKLFIPSDRASFITRPTIPVDGGWSTRLA
jgi:NAD(P)-dependent dehydrogenase (short-subunit alcohol dehydrogenase family)